VSVGAITWAYRQNVPQPGAKFVLVTLANYSDGDCFCYPGQARLAHLTSMSERSVRAHLAYLENKLALIKREHRRSEAGKWTSDGYQLQAPAEELNSLNPGGRQNLPQAKSAVGEKRPTAKSAANTKESKDDTKVSPARPSGSQKARGVTDARANHPAVQAVRASLGRYPQKVLWPKIVAVLGEEPDGQKVIECAIEYASRGKYTGDLTVWLFDWYENGIPERSMNHAGNGRPQASGRRDQPQAGERRVGRLERIEQTYKGRNYERLADESL
jgi:hypothetical protein